MKLFTIAMAAITTTLSCSAGVGLRDSGDGFGIQVPAVLDPQVWIPRIADAGARYVVTDAPGGGWAELARARGLRFNPAGYSNLGQWMPPGPPPPGKDRSVSWEVRFGMTDDSGGATARELIRLLIEVRSKGGNLVLSLPPKPDDATQVLEEIGRWLRVNRESVFDTSPSPFDRMPFFGRATARGNSLYLHLFHWPANAKLPVPDLQNKIVSAELLGTGMKLAVSGSTIELPMAAPHQAASVVKLTLDGSPKLRPYLIQPDQDGWITAPAESCEFDTRPGITVRREDRAGRVFLSHWTRAIDVPTWRVYVPQDGRYSVDVVYRAGEASKGVLFTITMKGPTMGMVKGTVEPTGGVSRRQVVSNMVLEAGNHMLLVQPENKPGQIAMELEAVILRRTGE